MLKTSIYRNGRRVSGFRSRGIRLAGEHGDDIIPGEAIVRALRSARRSFVLLLFRLQPKPKFDAKSLRTRRVTYDSCGLKNSLSGVVAFFGVGREGSPSHLCMVELTG